MNLLVLICFTEHAHLEPSFTFLILWKQIYVTLKNNFHSIPQTKSQMQVKNFQKNFMVNLHSELAYI